MINEHHQTATNLNPAGPIIMGILARETKRARLLILGNPIANRREPVRVAEEMAMVDVYSRGRLEVGFVRGVPYEISAGNHRPTRMMERFWEAHDLILKAWTSHDGPFNWEGKHFHHRQVNIWPRPYQQPHPPVWITALSPASARDVGEKGYVVACFLTGFQGTKTIFESYHTRRAELGLPAPGLDRFAYAALVYTGETDEEGYAGARKLMWYVESNKVPPQFTNPPGYHPIAATVSAMKGSAGIFKLFQNPTLEGFMENRLVFPSLQPQLTDLLLQLLTMEAQLRGCLGDVALVAAQGAADEITLEGLYYVLLGLPESYRTGNLCWTDLLAQAQISGLNLGSCGEDRRRFEHVFEFPHVARPGGTQQQPIGVGRHSHRISLVAGGNLFEK